MLPEWPGRAWALCRTQVAEPAFSQMLGFLDGDMLARPWVRFGTAGMDGWWQILGSRVHPRAVWGGTGMARLYWCATCWCQL